MKKISTHLFGIALILLGCNISIAQNRGLRPEINLLPATDSVYRKGTLLVKLKPEAEALLQSAKRSRIAGTGINSLDSLGAKLGVKTMEPMLTGLSQTSSSAARMTGTTDPFEARHRAWGFHLWYQIELPAEADIPEAIRAYEKLKDWIEVAEPRYNIISNAGVDAKLLAPFVPNDPLFANQWHYDNTGQVGGTADADIDLPEAWEIETGKPNVIVAIIDSGIDTTHTDLKPNLWIGQNGERLGYNFVTHTPKITPGVHGSHVAGTIGAVNNNSIFVSGIAGGNGAAESGARLMICGVGTDATFDDVAIVEAFIWSADRGAAIANNSWGSSPGGYYSQLQLDAIDYFIEYGGGNVLDKGLVVFAGGNSNSDYRQFPASYERVIAVGATNNKDRKASYSNFDRNTNISAPGGETSGNGGQGGVLSTRPLLSGEYGYMQGTSMASPHVSGAAALVASKAQGRLSADDVRSVLLTTVDNIDAVNDPIYAGKLGTGRLNAHKALLKTVEIIGKPEVSPIQNLTVNSSTCGQMNLSWSNNGANDQVMIAVATMHKGLFGIPENNYNVGDQISGGGKVIFKGNGTSFNYIDPNPGIDAIFFKIWSVNQDGFYSKGSITYVLKPYLPCLITDDGHGPIRFVKEGGTGDGTSWTQASGDLQLMLTYSQPGNEVWVAKGTYKPKRPIEQLYIIDENNRENAFVLKDGVKLYGGFPSDNNAATKSDRNTTANPTILSGDIGAPEANSDNAYHVVIGANVGSSTVLDGFNVTAGNGDRDKASVIGNVGIFHLYGGGFFNGNGNAIINNCIFSDNYARFGGGWVNAAGSPAIRASSFKDNRSRSGAGVYLDSGSPSFVASSFTGNQSSIQGGGVFNQTSSTFVNCVIKGNSAQTFGGGWLNTGGNPVITNTTITANTSASLGGGVVRNAGNPLFQNSILWGNVSQADAASNDNLNLDLSMLQHSVSGKSMVYGDVGGVDFGDASVLDPTTLLLSAGSPAINSGKNDLIPGDISTDLSGSARIQNQRIDLGAFEYQCEVTASASATEVIRLIFSGENYVYDACRLFAIVEPKGSAPVNGGLVAQSWIEPAIIEHNSARFVARHYDLAPDLSPDDAKADITLFFTKDDFQSYNTVYGDANNFSLPVNDGDNTSKLRVVQYHGGNGEGGLPGTYTSTRTIIPTSVTWNSATGLWAVKFPVTRFSGFFVTGQNDAALPVTLLSFKAEKNEKGVQLSWQTTDEINASHFEIERSANAKTFEFVGRVAAKSATENSGEERPDQLPGQNLQNYVFLDVPFLTQSISHNRYYRLKMIDLDGSFAYSRIQVVSDQDHANSLTDGTLYPNPASRQSVKFLTGASISANALVTIVDEAGKVVRRFDQQILAGVTDIDVSNLPGGIYMIKIETGDDTATKKLLVR